MFTLTYLFQLTAFGGFLKYTVSYDIPVETVDGDLMSHADVIIKVLAFTLLCCRVEGLSRGTVCDSEELREGLVAGSPGRGGCSARLCLVQIFPRPNVTILSEPIPGAASGQPMRLVPPSLKLTQLFS